jgi:hypothetical protein
MTIHLMPDACETPKLNEDNLLQCGKRLIVSDSPARCQAREFGDQSRSPNSLIALLGEGFDRRRIRSAAGASLDARR